MGALALHPRRAMARNTLPSKPNADASNQTLMVVQALQKTITELTESHTAMAERIEDMMSDTTVRDSVNAVRREVRDHTARTPWSTAPPALSVPPCASGA